jgi:phosphoglycerol transferase MdoB-like AlkP superfamily enzyme
MQQRKDSSRPHGNSLWAEITLFITILITLGCFRLFLFCFFRDRIGISTHLDQFLRCIGMGTLFDVSIASFFLFPTVIAKTIAHAIRMPSSLSVEISSHVLKLSQHIFAGTASLLMIIDTGYIAEYHNQFDHWLFGLVFDDRMAIAKTIWKTYPVTAIIGASIAIYLLLVRCITFLSVPRPRVTEIKAGRAMFYSVGILVLLTLGVRGSAGMRPLQEKDVAVTTDDFLNKLVLNPFKALYYAIHNHNKLNAVSGTQGFITDKEIHAAAKVLNPRCTSANLDDYLRREAAGSKKTPPDHIFLIIMESYDSWPVRESFRQLGLTDNLVSIGASGLIALDFLPSGTGTMTSLASIITGLPEVGVQPNYRKHIRSGLPTATAKIFNRLGYTTRFFYGGYLSWQRVGDFCSEQGFKEIHGGSEMSERLSGNEWGVDDDQLFRFVLSAIDPNTKSFNLILTTSNHPPYTVNLDRHGIQANLIRRTEIDAKLAHALAHLKFSDLSLGSFHKSVLEKLPNSFFAITGDHWSRRFPKTKPSLFDTSTVPLVLSGPQITSSHIKNHLPAGSHIDIAPTLIELVAPERFEYHTFGRDLLNDPKPYSFGYHRLLMEGHLVDTNSPDIYYDSSGNRGKTGADEKVIVTTYRQISSLAWWRAMRGNTLPPHAH